MARNDPLSDKRKLLGLLRERNRREANTKYLSVYHSFYDWQHDFVTATANYHECCLCAANQIGKTYLGTDIDAMHLLGEYPDDWTGHRFNFAPMCWGLGYSMEKCRDLLQKALFGELIAGKFQGGLVPADRILSHEAASGTANAARTVRIKHKRGTSTMQFWSYTQGQHAIMGDVVDWVHVDEEPKDQTIRPQLLTRTINGDKGKGGRIIYTFTPENGRTELVVKFMDDPTVDQFFMKKGWDDAPHMTPDKCERLLAQYPEHQRDMRSKGEPMLGHGRIYDIGDEFILCEPFPIPNHWFVIGALDFGWDHPQAHVQLVEDRDKDIVYLTKSWKARQVSANDAWGAVKHWNQNIPIAWPSDGLQERDATGQKKLPYVNAGFKMMPGHACWPDMADEKGTMQKGGMSVETGIYELADRMRTGRFKVFQGQADFMDEFRQYHRDEKGKIVKASDDLLDATRYAYMMRRFAVRMGETSIVPKVHMPQPIRVNRR